MAAPTCVIAARLMPTAGRTRLSIRDVHEAWLRWPRTVRVGVHADADVEDAPKVREMLRRPQAAPVVVVAEDDLHGIPLDRLRDVPELDGAHCERAAVRPSKGGVAGERWCALLVASGMVANVATSPISASEFVGSSRYSSSPSLAATRCQLRRLARQLLGAGEGHTAAA